MDLSYDDVQNILKIIDASSLEELHLEIGELKLIVRKRADAASPGAEPRGGAVDSAPRAALLAASPPNSPASTAGGPPRPRSDASEGQEAQRPVQPRRSDGVEVKSPMVGTFYRGPAPGAPPFVEVGSVVAEDDTVCIIEVMKLMNSIRPGCRGRVAEVCVENGSMVEFGQTLMIIEPI